MVDVAGAWLRAVAALAGAGVPMVPTRHQLLITEAIDGVDPMQPITRIIDANVYLRPDAGGLMLGGYEADPVQYDPAALPARFAIADLALDLKVLRRPRTACAHSFPSSSPCLARSGVCAPRRAPDHDGGRPTHRGTGAGGLRGLYVAGGCCVGGLSITPALGEALAAWIIDGTPPMDLSPMAPGREAGMDEELLRTACRLQYAHLYW